MAVSPETIKHEYPLPVYNYRVEIGSDAVAFSEVSGLTIAYEVTTYKESRTTGNSAGPAVMHMPSQATVTTITLKKGLVPTVSLPALYDWIQTVQTNQVVKKDIFVRLLDAKGETMITWTVTNAFPVKLDAPQLSASSNDAAIETMELRADGVAISKA